MRQSWSNAIRLAVQLLGALWSVGGALVVGSSATAIWLWRAAALQVERGYPPGALALLHGIPHASALFGAHLMLGLAAIATGVAVLRLRPSGRVAALALSALGAALITGVSFLWWV